MVAGLVVCICGGRAHLVTLEEAKRLELWAKANKIARVIHGGADGVDSWAGLWGRSRGIQVRVYPADWDALGRAAGPIRNKTMAAVADVVIAFPGGRGTESMVAAARAAGKRVEDWR